MTNNKTALVTGGTRGIGRAIVQALAEDGYTVALCGRDQRKASDAARELSQQTGGRVVGTGADVAQANDVARLFTWVESELGGLDVLVNNAGVGVFKKAGELSVDDWRLTLDTNLSGVFYACREALPRFQKRGGGYIINISSLAGKNPFAGGSAYNASKFALNGFTEAAMLDHRYENVRFSYIMPGSVDTEFGGHSDPASWKIQPADIAEIVRMLLRMPERTLVSRIEVRPSQPKKKEA